MKHGNIICVPCSETEKLRPRGQQGLGQVTKYAGDVEALCVFMPWGGETCGNVNWMEKVFHSLALGWGPAYSPWSYY